MKFWFIHHYIVYVLKPWRWPRPIWSHLSIANKLIKSILWSFSVIVQNFNVEKQNHAYLKICSFQIQINPMNGISIFLNATTVTIKNILVSQSSISKWGYTLVNTDGKNNNIITKQRLSCNLSLHNWIIKKLV